MMDSQSNRNSPPAATAQELHHGFSPIQRTEDTLLEVHKGQQVKLKVKVLVPVQDHPNYNFMGKLLGPRGNSLKWLQELTQTKMAILGKGSMRDKQKEAELRRLGDPKYGHLSEELHVEITATAPPPEAYSRIGHALHEVKRFLVPDYYDEIRQQQLRELGVISGDNVKSSSSAPGGRDVAAGHPPTGAPAVSAATSMAATTLAGGGNASANGKEASHHHHHHGDYVESAACEESGGLPYACSCNSVAVGSQVSSPVSTTCPSQPHHQAAKSEEPGSYLGHRPTACEHLDAGGHCPALENRNFVNLVRDCRNQHNCIWTNKMTCRRSRAAHANTGRPYNLANNHIRYQ